MCGFCVIVWTPRFHWQPCDQDSGQGHSRSLRVVERSTSCLPACRPATLLRFFTAACAPPFDPRSPVSVPGDRARSRAGPYETCPELRETTSTSVGINLDISQLSKICAWRKDIIFMVNDEKTAVLPQVAVTKSIRPLWETQCRGQSVIVQVFAAGFASPSSCPNATELMATGQR